MSFHSGQTFVYGETPSASKWQFIWDNDTALANGSAITALDLSVTSHTNPYKFHAYRNAAQNTGNAAFAVVAYDTEDFDSNNNLAAGVYTVPVSGFYLFNATVTISNPSTVDGAAGWLKNGSLTEYKRIGEITVATSNLSMSGTILIQLTAGNTISVGAYAASTKALVVGSPVYNHFSGFLVSQL